MNLIRKLLSPILAITTLVQVSLAARGDPVPREHIDKPGTAVNLLLAGLGGFGEDVGLNYVVPYFGVLTGLEFGPELETLGYETYQPNIGPMSSMWDRSCEIYAQLTGTRVDYGAAHSARCGHERFGREYDKPLFEGWGPLRPLNLIGHSFGANTARMFALLLDEGDAAERKATPKAERSPLFNGGMIDRVHSITTLAGVHNGTTAMGTLPDDYDEDDYLFIAELLNDLGTNRTVNRLWDLHLEHFGLSVEPGGRYLFKKTDEELARDFLNSLDHSLYECSIDGAAAFNKIDKIHPTVYYFSHSSVISRKAAEIQLPHAREILDPVIFLFSFQIGRGMGWIPSPGGEWLANDGVVPLPSALYPKGQPHRGFVPGKTKVEPGVWNVMPTIQNADHAFWCGGDFMRHSQEEVFGIYANIMELLEGTY